MTNQLQCLHEVFKRNLYTVHWPLTYWVKWPPLNALRKMFDRNFKGHFHITCRNQVHVLTRNDLFGADQTNSAQRLPQEFLLQDTNQGSQNENSKQKPISADTQYLSKFVCSFKHAALSKGLIFFIFTAPGKGRYNSHGIISGMNTWK